MAWFVKPGDRGLRFRVKKMLVFLTKKSRAPDSDLISEVKKPI